MINQPPEPDVAQLLADLQDDRNMRRLEAVQALAAAKLDTPEVVNALKAAADKDSSRYVREAALSALNALGPSVGDLKAYTAPAFTAKPVKELTRNEKLREFAIGFGGWFVVNGLIWLALSFPNGAGDNMGFGLATFPANLSVLLILAFTRRWVALGMLSALALNFLIALILGLAFNGYCFVPFFIPTG